VATLNTTSLTEVAGVTFSDSDTAPVPKFLNLDLGAEIFQIENPTPVQIPLTIDPTGNLLMFLLKK